MSNPGGFFEIPVLDLERAIRFYSSVFGYEFARESVDGNDMAFFPGAPDQPGCSGALSQGASYRPGTDGVRVYLNADDIDALLAKVVAAGGEVLYPKTSIGKYGFVAEFTDSEGNRLALHSLH